MSLLQKRETLWALGLLTLVCQLSITVMLAPVDSALRLLQLQTTFSPDQFMMILGGWNESRAERYLAHYYVDFLYPLVYSVFLAVCLRQLVGVSQRPWLLALPFVAGAGDLVENLVQASLVLGLLPFSSPLFYLGAAAAWGKWLSITVVTLVIASRIFGLGPKGPLSGNV